MKFHIMVLKFAFVAVFCMSLLALLDACSNTVDASKLEFPYEEKIAIGGFLFAGDSVETILLSATTPILDSSKAKVLDGVEAVIRVDGRAYPLALQRTQTSTGKMTPSFFSQLQQQKVLYRPAGLVGIAGKTYTIEVKWNGKTAQATTTIPMPLEPDSVAIFTDEKRISLTARAIIRPRANETYSMIHTHVGTSRNRPLTVISPYSPLGRLQEAQADGKLTLSSAIPTFDRFSEGLTWLYDSLDSFQSHATVYAYDGQYWDYYQSQQQKNRTADIVAITAGSNLQWNVKGDGYGLFIGVSSTRTPLKKSKR
jgi:hypothetical protein